MNSNSIAPSKEDPTSIQKMFGKIAPSYDKGNSVLSFSMHRLWNAALVSEVTGNQPVARLLDLCSGTGDIAYAYMLRVKQRGEVVLLDFCKEMLAEAKKKASDLNLDQSLISYIEGDAQQLPIEDESIDCATVAYGIRNVKEPARCLREVFRTLKPGGRFGILELTRPSNPVLRWGHSTYLRTALPLIGKFFLSSEEAYSYLNSSIHSFISPDELEQIMREVGFVNLRQRPLMGGIATILVGEKPLADGTTPQWKREELPSVTPILTSTRSLSRINSGSTFRTRRRRLASM